jgi:acetoacetyl-CoA synthetase
LSGKKLEVPIKKLMLGMPMEKAVSMDALSNPSALRPFEEIAQRVEVLRQS